MNRVYVLLISLFILFNSQLSFGQNQITLTKALKWVSNNSDYSFLYRESFTNNFTIPEKDNIEEQIDLIRTELPKMGIQLLVDSARKHIVIFKNSTKKAEKVFIRGIVIDDESSERLAYAPIYYQKNASLSDVPCDEQGRFSVQYDINNSGLFEFSYLGYESFWLSVPQNAGYYEYTIRLKPSTLWFDEVLVEQVQDINSKILHGISSNRLGVGAEASFIRSTQYLPSVQILSALDQDLISRGSTPDGVQIRKDGVASFQNSHIFGFVDTYSPEALRYSGVHFDWIPGEFQSTSGGLIDIQTKNGSFSQSNYYASISNTAFNVLVDGPFANQSGSFLIGGKIGLLDQLNVLGNKSRIAWGLNTNRSFTVTDNRYTPTSTNIYIPNSPTVSFYDLHGKFHLEMEDGSTFQIVGYLGGDDIQQIGQRYYQSSLNSSFDSRFSLDEVESSNAWNQYQVGLHWWKTTESWLFKAKGHYSFFETTFRQDDYSYLQPNPQDDALQRAFIDNYNHDNQISELQFEGQAIKNIGRTSFQMGATATQYELSYIEESITFPLYSTYQKVLLLEPYVEMKTNILDAVELKSGLRYHFYSDGSYHRLSPRIKAEYGFLQKNKLSVGYTRGYQFLHRLTLYNSLVSDVWISTTNEQAPLEFDHIFADYEIRFNSNLYLKSSIYQKWMSNVRMHEINTRHYSTALNTEPWFFDHNVSSKGIESQLYWNQKSLRSNLAYTYSITEMENSSLNNGIPFPAYWDRRHQFSTQWEWQFLSNLSLQFTGVLASGMPAREPGATGVTPDRLGWHRRIDSGLSYESRFTNGSRIKAQFSIYNLFNIQNDWYRDEIQAFDSTTDNAELITVEATIHDLGFMPSFLLSIQF